MKYESFIFYGSKVKAKVKVFVHAANADADADTDGRAMSSPDIRPGLLINRKSDDIMIHCFRRKNPVPVTT